MNHFNADLPEGLWWTQQPMMEPTPKTLSSKHKGLIPQPNHPWSSHHQHHHQVWLGSQEAATASMFCGQNNTLSFNLNEEEDEDLDEQLTDERETLTKEEEEGEEEEEREAMFEKPLTPSDVGKLNRLVIPKQHAEKYFPLGGGGGGDSGDKGLLLSFEDESGKCWRFRYSYWNSSQSYVLTKGWSRFVKEKRLDAGDVVLFQRHRTDGDRLFIGWRRRAAPVQDIEVAQPAMPPPPTAGWTQVFYSTHPYPSHPHGPPLPYQSHCLHAGSVGPTQTTPAVNSKRLRLFGVNMECQIDESSEEPVTHHGPSLSSQGPAHHQFHSGGQGSNHHNHMDINFSRDVNQMRNRRG